MELMRILVDAVILLTLLEFLLLRWFFGRSGRGVAPRLIGLNLFSGLALMAALRFAIADAPSPWLIALFLAAAGLLHGLDLARQWRR
jgi:uncharacterized membrane protein SirB2